MLDHRNELVAALLEWFQQSARDLPWRGTQHPYAIWVSEMMLQQTKVQTVIPYFKRWLSAFPTVQSLAEAGLDEVLKKWEGLGYYRRARFMHEAARQIACAGQFPEDYERILDLPGVGRYT